MGLLLNSCKNYKEEAPGTPPTYHYAYTSLAGVDFDFTLENGEISFTNNNDVVVKVDLFNKTTNTYLVKELVTLPLNTDTAYMRDVDEGDLLEFKVWRGVVSVYYANIHGTEPDFQGQGQIIEGEFELVNTSTKNTYQILVGTINGAACQFDGRYAENNPLDQSNNSFFCENLSSDPIRVEVYTLKLRNGGGYEANFQLCTFWIALQNYEDITFLDYDFPDNVPLAIRVTSFDPLNHWKTSDIKGLTLSVPNQNYTPIYSPIYLP
ncbi:MAG: hypothetical protein NTX82_05155 [Candidatus Parcubacteria bacterium]|nr:hypothetical protein [Candidatus Parcubacteria bacterium]